MLLQLKSIVKEYTLGDTTIRALDGVDLEIMEGEYVAIMGPSGSGKSTMLQISSMLDRPSSGNIYLKNRDVTTLSEPEMARLRNQEIGFVFQQFNLLPKTSALDNVALPLVYANRPDQERIERAKTMLERVGLGTRLKNTRAQLSGGQQQRVAIARALINDPAIVFADEPTGNLDSKSGDEIIEMFNELNKEGRTIILVTHELDVAQYAKRIITMRDGKIIDDKKNTPPTKSSSPDKKSVTDKQSV